MMRQPKILIVAPHGIGDAIMTCQAVEELFPSSNIYFLTNDRATSEVIGHITGCPQEKIIFLREEGRSRITNAIRVWYRLLRAGFDGSLCQYGVSSWQYALLTLASGVRTRLGWTGTLSFLNSGNVNAGTMHKVDATRLGASELARKLGIPLRTASARCTNSSKRHGPIILGISSFEAEKHKRWPLTRFAELCRMLEKDFPNRKIVLLGSKDERAYCDDLISLAKASGVQNKCGKLTLPEVCTEIAGASLVIANCNAISHMAGFYNIPTIGLYGPTDPAITGPKSPNLIAIKTSLSCAPCYSAQFSHGCGAPTCMNDISVDIVHRAATRMLPPHE